MVLLLRIKNVSSFFMMMMIMMNNVNSILNGRIRTVLKENIMNIHNIKIIKFLVVLQIKSIAEKNK